MWQGITWASLQEDNGRIYEVAFAPDGKSLALRVGKSGVRVGELSAVLGETETGLLEALLGALRQ